MLRNQTRTREEHHLQNSTSQVYIEGPDFCGVRSHNQKCVYNSDANSRKIEGELLAHTYCKTLKDRYWLRPANKYDNVFEVHISLTKLRNNEWLDIQTAFLKLSIKLKQHFHFSNKLKPL